MLINRDFLRINTNEDMNDIKIIESNLNDAVKLLKELPVEQGELIHDYVDYALKLVKKHDFIGSVSGSLPNLEESETERSKYANRITNEEHKFGFGLGFDCCYEWITKTGVYSNDR